MTSKPTWWLFAVLSAPLCMGADACSDDTSAAVTCEVEGATYAEGDTFPSADGCNTCSCTAMGVACTERACVDGGAGCKVGAKTYAEGDTFPSVDGCNSCSCADGKIECTARACFDGCESDGIFYTQGQTWKQECATCTCTAGGIACDAVVCDDTRVCTLGDREFPFGATVICEDGCNSCACGGDGTPGAPASWGSTLIACSPLSTIEVCDEARVEPGVTATPLYLSGNALALEIGGTCKAYGLRLCTDGSFLESNPVQLKLWVVEDERPATCTSGKLPQIVFDLTPLQALYQASYQSDRGTIILRLDDSSATYSF